MTIMNQIRKDTSKEVAFRVIRWTLVDALLGTACGALYGLVFGGLGVVLHEPWEVLTATAYCALSGAAAGALLGLVGGILEGRRESAMGNTRRKQAGEPDVQVKAASLPQTASDRERPASAHRSERRHLALASRDHSLV